MIAAIPAEDQPTIIVQVVLLPPVVERVPVSTHVARVGVVCLSCGSKTNEHGVLPCGH